VFVEIVIVVAALIAAVLIFPATRPDVFSRPALGEHQGAAGLDLPAHQ
jgi:hypothetical protein